MLKSIVIELDEKDLKRYPKGLRSPIWDGVRKLTLDDFVLTTKDTEEAAKIIYKKRNDPPAKAIVLKDRFKKLKKYWVF